MIRAVIRHSFLQNHYAHIGWSVSLKSKLKLRWCLSMCCDKTMLSYILPYTWLNAIPRKLELSDRLLLRPLGIGTIVLTQKLFGAVPWTVIEVSRRAMWVKQSSPALMTLSVDKHELPSFLCGFNLPTADLTFWEWTMQSDNSESPFNRSFTSTTML